MSSLLITEQQREAMAGIQKELLASATATTTDTVKAENALQQLLAPLGGKHLITWVDDLEQAEAALGQAKCGLAYNFDGMVDEEMYEMAGPFRRYFSAFLCRKLQPLIYDFCLGESEHSMLKTAKETALAAVDETDIPNLSNDDAMRLLTRDTWFDLARVHESKTQSKLQERLGPGLGASLATRFYNLFQHTFIDCVTEVQKLVAIRSWQAAGVIFDADHLARVQAAQDLLESAFACWVFTDGAIIMRKPKHVKIDADGYLVGLSWDANAPAEAEKTEPQTDPVCAQQMN